MILMTLATVHLSSTAVSLHLLDTFVYWSVTNRIAFVFSVVTMF